MDSFGFIITRHVNSFKTNNYWNQCIKLLRMFYPNKKIVIIDDNSDYNYVKSEFEYKNIQIIQSEFIGRGELLPYYYLLKFKFFKNAIIMHDSVFIHKRINFDKLNGLDVLPLWYFNSDKENIENTRRLIRGLKNNILVENMMTNFVMGLKTDKWHGCYGVQSYINLNFLERIQEKYKITNLLLSVKSRADRCCLERIFGCIFCKESNSLHIRKSLLGDIMKYQKWGYSYDEYMDDLKKGKLIKFVIKVWTGR